MPITTKYLFIASMDVERDKEALFNEVYDHEHVPNLMKVPGVLAITRLKTAPLKMSIGGEVRAMATEDEPAYSAIYEIESPEVLVSREWAQAVEAGRWPAEVRPFTKNRRHLLRKVMVPSE